jgi:hypothetical protein
MAAVTIKKGYPLILPAFQGQLNFEDITFNNLVGSGDAQTETIEYTTYSAFDWKGQPISRIPFPNADDPIGDVALPLRFANYSLQYYPTRYPRGIGGAVGLVDFATLGTFLATGGIDTGGLVNVPSAFAGVLTADLESNGVEYVDTVGTDHSGNPLPDQPFSVCDNGPWQAGDVLIVTFWAYSGAPYLYLASQFDSEGNLTGWAEDGDIMAFDQAQVANAIQAFNRVQLMYFFVDDVPDQDGLYTADDADSALQDAIAGLPLVDGQPVATYNRVDSIDDATAILTAKILDFFS